MHLQRRIGDEHGDPPGRYIPPTSDTASHGVETPIPTPLIGWGVAQPAAPVEDIYIYIIYRRTWVYRGRVPPDHHVRTRGVYRGPGTGCVAVYSRLSTSYEQKAVP